MKQSMLNLDATLDYVKKNDDAGSYYALKVSQYVAQIIFEEPRLRFAPR